MSTVIFITGPAGSGKSTLGQLIASRFRAAYIDKDTVCNILTERLLECRGADPTERDNSPIYQSEVMDLEYDTIMKVAASNLVLGNDVVLDAPFGRYLPQDDYIERASERYRWPNDAHAVVIHVKVSSEIVRKRVEARGLDRDAWKLAHWDEFWETAGRDVCKWRDAAHIHFENDDPAANFPSLVGQIPM